MNHTEASLEQRQQNSREIAERKRRKQYCKWGHKNWKIKSDGCRMCVTCNSLRSWYYKRGLSVPPGGPG